MNAGAMAQRLEGILHLRTLYIALGSLFALLLTLILSAGFLGRPVSSGIEVLLPLPQEKTVAMQSGDLNQLDLKLPAPAQPNETKPGPQDIEDAVAGLHETTPEGLVPVIRKEDGLTAFKAYAAPFTLAADAKGRIALVMVDYGLSDKGSASVAAQLPGAVTFALDPNTRQAQKWTGEARKNSHEVWISLPLQTRQYPAIDTGPRTLLVYGAPEETTKRLLQTLALSTGYAGVVANDAASFAGAKDSLKKIMDEISGRGLGIVQSDPGDKILPSMLTDGRMPFGQANIWIDQVSSEKNLLTTFADIEAAAQKNKTVIVFFRPYPALVKAVANWSNTIDKRGLQLAPLSAVVN